MLGLCRENQYVAISVVTVLLCSESVTHKKRSESSLGTVRYEDAYCICELRLEYICIFSVRYLYRLGGH